MSKIYHTGMVHYAAQADRYEWPCTGAELPSTSGTAGLLTWRCDIGTKGNPCLSVSMYFLYLYLYIDALCEPSVPWQPLRLTTFELVLIGFLCGTQIIPVVRHFDQDISIGSMGGATMLASDCTLINAANSPTA